MFIALGSPLQGQKKILGFVQTATENESVCAAFLPRGSSGGWMESALLFVMDGAKGLRTAIQTVFDIQVLVPRCQ